MHVQPEPSLGSPNRGPEVSLSVGSVCELEGRRVAGAGVAAVADGLVALHRFRELLENFAVRAEWLRATFALTSRPTRCGVARSNGGSPVAGFCGSWQSTPRPMPRVAGKNIASKESLESDLAACFSTAHARRDDDPFPHWQLGEPWPPVFSERAC